MNNSWRRINEDVIEILTQPKETAFDGTVKEGFIRKYTIINERDFRKYVPDELKEDFSNVFNKVAEHIEEGRVAEGKSPYNNYIVINLDEPYIDEIIEILKRNGHWG